MNTHSNYPPGVLPQDIEGDQRKIRYMRRTMRESVQVRLGESYREKQAQRFAIIRQFMDTKPAGVDWIGEVEYSEAAVGKFMEGRGPQ